MAERRQIAGGELRQEVKGKGDRPLRNCPVGNFREETDSGGELRQEVKGERRMGRRRWGCWKRY